MLKYFIALLLIANFTHELIASDWPMFRGPAGNGTTNEPETPTTWNETTNIKWKTTLKFSGNGSPVVSQGKVFLDTKDDEDGLSRSLTCFDAATGKELWSKAVSFNKKMPTHKTNPYAPSTPASNGKHVAVWHGSAGLYVYTHDGQEVWHKELGEFKHIWGYGTSPTIVDDKLILYTGPGKNVFVVAYQMADGKELWKHEESADNQEFEDNDKRYHGSWSTPVLWYDTLICSFTTRVVGIDPETGKVKWFCSGTSGPKGDLAYSSPLTDETTCMISGGFQGPAYGFSLATDLSGEQKSLWRLEKNPQNIGSGLIREGYFYRVNAGPNTIDCLDIKNGKQLWQHRGTGNAFWGSISFNGKYAYVTDQNGTTIVFEPSPEKLKVIAENSLKDKSNSTPALSDGKIFIRTEKALWCIGK